MLCKIIRLFLSFFLSPQSIEMLINLLMVLGEFLIGANRNYSLRHFVPLEIYFSTLELGNDE